MPRRNSVGTEIVERRLFDVRLPQGNAVEVQHAVIDLYDIVFNGDAALDKIHRFRVLDVRGMKYDDLASGRRREMVNKLVDQDIIVDQQGGNHGLGGNIKTPDHKGNDQDGHHTGHDERVQIFASDIAPIFPLGPAGNETQD